MAAACVASHHWVSGYLFLMQTPMDNECSSVQEPFFFSVVIQFFVGFLTKT